MVRVHFSAHPPIDISWQPLPCGAKGKTSARVAKTPHTLRTRRALSILPRSGGPKFARFRGHSKVIGKNIRFRFCEFRLGPDQASSSSPANANEQEIGTVRTQKAYSLISGISMKTPRIARIPITRAAINPRFICPLQGIRKRRTSTGRYISHGNVVHAPKLSRSYPHSAPPKKLRILVVLVSRD